LVRKERYLVAAVLITLLTSSFLSINILQATANPIAIALEDTYGYLILDNNVSLPEAFVNVSIESSPVEVSLFEITQPMQYNITMDAVYTFVSPTTQFTTVGLACPYQWTEYDYAIQIFQGQSTLPYTILNYSELVSENETQTSSWEYLRFFAFNCSFQTGTPTNISILMDLGTRVIRYAGWQFRYFVATARSWNGTTHETITMSVENPSVFRSCSFWPNSCLMVADNPPWRTATWDLNMSEFEYDYVTFATYHKDSSSGIDLSNLPLLGAVAIAVCGVVVMVVFIQRKSTSG
jgi:hypothetical protein